MRRFLAECGQKFRLLMDPMTEETLDAIGTGNAAPIQKDKPPEKQAAEKIYRDPETGRIGLPAEMISSCLVGAGRNVKNGKKQISTATSTGLFDLIEIQGEFFPFVNIPEGASKEEERQFWKVDKRRGVGQTGTAVRIIRPSFSEWCFEVVIDIDEKKVNPAVIRKLFEIAGSGVGVGSFRPSRKGPFGRFAVLKWTDITPAEWLKTGESETPDEEKKPKARRGAIANRLTELDDEETGEAATSDGELVGADA